ncbi:hypothetical protein AADZ91_01885 [Colwelliaceae bacterium 6441]
MKVTSLNFRYKFTLAVIIVLLLAGWYLYNVSHNSSLLGNKIIEPPILVIENNITTDIAELTIEKVSASTSTQNKIEEKEYIGRFIDPDDMDMSVNSSDVQEVNIGDYIDPEELILTSIDSVEKAINIGDYIPINSYSNEGFNDKEAIDIGEYIDIDVYLKGSPSTNDKVSEIGKFIPVEKDF